MDDPLIAEEVADGMNNRVEGTDAVDSSELLFGYWIFFVID